MSGQRLANGHQFTCPNLEGKTIECFKAYVDIEKKEHIIMVFLKLKGEKLWHRFFLDAGLGFWEEWDETSAFEGVENDSLIDLAEKYNVRRKIVSSITCRGSYHELSSMEFLLDDMILTYRYSYPGDSESPTIFE
ncbi:MAG: hypothetical protein D3926_01155 [Desulfobacteraceae bacterium]|nr:MAG: hypothetical protein D3926_01155 [Desulfobacteraceae bacterium]